MSRKHQKHTVFATALIVAHFVGPQASKTGQARQRCVAQWAAKLRDDDIMGVRGQRRNSPMGRKLQNHTGATTFLRSSNGPLIAGVMNTQSGTACVASMGRISSRNDTGGTAVHIVAQWAAWVSFFHTVRSATCVGAMGRKLEKHTVRDSACVAQWAASSKTRQARQPA